MTRTTKLIASAILAIGATGCQNPSQQQTVATAAQISPLSPQAEPVAVKAEEQPKPPQHLYSGTEVDGDHWRQIGRPEGVAPEKIDGFWWTNGDDEAAKKYPEKEDANTYAFVEDYDAQKHGWELTTTSGISFAVGCDFRVNASTPEYDHCLPLPVYSWVRLRMPRDLAARGWRSQKWNAIRYKPFESIDILYGDKIGAICNPDHTCETVEEYVDEQLATYREKARRGLN